MTIKVDRKEKERGCWLYEPLMMMMGIGVDWWKDFMEIFYLKVQVLSSVLP